MRFEALVRRLQKLAGDQQPSLDEFGATIISQLLPAHVHLAKAGKLFGIDMSAGTAIAPVTAMPTDSPQWGLYNASPNELMVVLQVSVLLQSGTAGLGLSIVGTSAIGPQTAVTADYSGTVKSCLDGSNRSPLAYLASNPTLVGGTPPWVTLECTRVNSIANDAVNEGLIGKVDGMIVARPGGIAAFEVVGETGTTALWDFNAIIAMVDADYY